LSSSNAQKNYWLEVLVRPKILFYEDPTDNMDDKVANEIIDYRQRTPMDHYCIIKNQYWKASVTEILL
jgi:ABC-type ATPase involved in cell division